MKNILLIDNYDSFTYNLLHYLGEEGASVEVVRNDKLDLDAIEQSLDSRFRGNDEEKSNEHGVQSGDRASPEPRPIGAPAFTGAVGVSRSDREKGAHGGQTKIQGIVISPGPGTPDDSGLCPDIIRRFGPHIPIFGVCLGLQTMGAVYGGVVLRAPSPMHGKTSLIHHNGAGVFKDIPTPFTATRYHSLIVDRFSCPDCLEITAWTEDGLIMGLQHREYPVCGVQFHPESIASEHGHQILRNFLAMV